MQDKITEKLTQAFRQATYEPSLGLTDNIWRALVIHKKHNAKIKLWIFSLVGIISFAGLVPAFNTLSTDFAKSGFYEYFSLIFGNGSILSYWKELSLSLVESLPIMSIIFTLSLIFICLFSLRHLVKQFGQLSLPLSI